MKLATKLFEFLYIDQSDFTPIYNKSTRVLFIIDNFTKYVFFYTLKSKNESSKVIKITLTRIECIEYKIKRIRLDGEIIIKKSAVKYIKKKILK